jgi:hypothetical protein
VVSVGTKPLLVHVVKALTKSIDFQSSSLFRNSSGLATKARPLSLMPSPPVILMPPSLYRIPTKEGLLVPRTNPWSPLHAKQEDRRLAGDPRRLQGPSILRLQLRCTQELAQDIYTLLSHFNRASLALSLTKLVLKFKNLINELLDSLENFFRVWMLHTNSSSLK